MKPWLLLTLILATVGGGFTGCAICVQTLITGGRGMTFAVIVLLFLFLYSFVTISGLLLVHNPRRTGPALAALAMQIPSISSSSLTYQFCSGFQFETMVGMPSGAWLHRFPWNVHFFMGSYFNFDVAGARDTPLLVGVNVVALLLFLLLWEERRKGARRTELPAIQTPPAPDATLPMV